VADKKPVYRDDWRVKSPKKFTKEFVIDYTSGLITLNAILLKEIKKMWDENS
jgi:hypothetical protein